MQTWYNWGKIRKKESARLLDLADILHCEPVEITAANLI